MTITAIVGAFNAFVAWAIDFIESTVNAVFGPIIDGVQSLLSGYNAKVLASIEAANIERDTTGTVSTTTAQAVGNAIYGDLFNIILEMTIALDIALLVLTAVTNVFSFCLILVGSIALGILVNSMFNAGSTHKAEVEVTKDDVNGIYNGGGIVTMSQCRSLATNAGINPPSHPSLEADIIDIGVSQFVWKAQWGIELAYGTGVGSASIAFGGIAIALSILGTITQIQDISEIALWVSIFGMIYDVAAAAYQHFGLQKTPVAELMDEFIGMGLNGVSLSISIYALNVP